MSYFDFYLVPVPRQNAGGYEELARISTEVLRECGALRTVECWLDESGPEASSYHAETARRQYLEYPGFALAAGARSDETVVVSFVEWPDKTTRDIGMERATSDPRMQFGDRPVVFEGGRLIAGGFRQMSLERACRKNTRGSISFQAFSALLGVGITSRPVGRPRVMVSCTRTPTGARRLWM